MTHSAAAIGEADASVTAYEQLRRHVLAGAAGAGAAWGLVLVVREGVAAWLERRPAGAAGAAPTAACERPVGASLAAEDFPASVVRVLASMAISNGGERRSGR